MSEFSSKPPFTPSQRRWSRRVWLSVLGIFLFFELLGTRKWTPWRTASETTWDEEREHPKTAAVIFGFLLGLAVHIRYRTKFFRSIAAGIAVSELTRRRRP